MRVINPNVVGLIATHAILETGIHGITGALINNPVGAGGITFLNPSGANPLFTATDIALSWLKLTTAIFEVTGVITSNALEIVDYADVDGYLDVAGNILCDSTLKLKSGTIWASTLSHTNTDLRTYTFPDVTGTIIVDNDTGKSLSLAQLTIENAGAGANPVIASNSVNQEIRLTGCLSSTEEILTDTNLYFKSATAFWGIFDHAISASRTWTLPDIAGTLCVWDAANAPVTRHLTIDYAGLACLATDGGGFDWLIDNVNEWVDCNDQIVAFLGINLPHGAIVTAYRVLWQEVTVTLVSDLIRLTKADGTKVTMAVVLGTSSLEEVADTSIDYATIDNDTYAYHIQVENQTVTTEGRIRSIQIDYTVTKPYP